MQFLIGEKIYRGLIIFKSIGDKNVESLKVQKLGYMIGAVDEEGMMFLMKNIIVVRYIKNLKLVDIFFCWGKKEYNAIINNFPEFQNKVFITGNQGIDVPNKVNDKYIKGQIKLKKNMEISFFLQQCLLWPITKWHKQRIVLCLI